MWAILPLVFACSAATPAARSTPVTSQSVLVTADWEAPGTFDPSPPITVTRLRADTLLFRRLWIAAPGGGLVPDLATSVPHPSGSELRVSLRPNLRWSDGTPLTAADVAYSVGPAARAESLTSLVIRASARSLSSVFVVPEHRLRGADRAAFFAAPDVVSGPFRLGSVAPDRIVYDRNPFYSGREPYVAEIVELLLPSKLATIEAAETGEVDLLPHLGPADVGASVGGLRTVITRSERLEMLVPHDLDPRLVTILSQATDRRQLIPRDFPQGGGRNLALAKLLLGGARPQVRLYVPCNDDVRAAEASVLAAQWADAGVAATVSCGVQSAPGLSLTADLTLQPGAVPLAFWPDVRAVSPRLHGFAPDDSSATDFWNAADWWLA